ncbi:DUF1573 domain-containing protein [Flavisolibacter nicotianae]|uniref:DUF1573 domain-containing protein n=1 Tax=Flavisolibacter nicotianae TaxID=2364882 RepID=UPI000EAE2484|nr:DUF1573 domain-containing protein [Flavisolibacter nicotianae]
MKQLFTLFVLMTCAFAGHAQTATEALEVKEQEYNFGTIPQGKPVYHVFQIANKGAIPLKLDNVQASCGCTTPEWSKDPIPAGGADKIRVGYNAAAEGPFEKVVTVTYNGNSTKLIRIKGEVWRAPAGSAPSNASINFLKQQMQ